MEQKLIVLHRYLSAKSNNVIFEKHLLQKILYRSKKPKTGFSKKSYYFQTTFCDTALSHCSGG